MAIDLIADDQLTESQERVVLEEIKEYTQAKKENYARLASLIYCALQLAACLARDNPLSTLYTHTDSTTRTLLKKITGPTVRYAKDNKEYFAVVTDRGSLKNRYIELKTAYINKGDHLNYDDIRQVAKTLSIVNMQQPAAQISDDDMKQLIVQAIQKLARKYPYELAFCTLVINNINKI